MTANGLSNESTMLSGKWFSEINDLWHGQAFSLKYKEVLYHEKSQFQDILVIESEGYGKVLILDGVIQCTERDEFSYHEMISHLPMFSHPCPKSVLVVGGGDGGVLRELGKHPTVEELHICEIDKQVIEVSKKYFSKTACGFDNPIVTVHNMDGAKFMSMEKEAFDVIITDSSDPIGPAKALFEQAYFEKVYAALKPGGIMCMQGECVWFTLELIEKIMAGCKKMFSVTDYAYTVIPTYPCGQIGFVLAGKSEDINFRIPRRTLTPEEEEELSLKYYDSDIHKAAFVLPRFARKALE